MNQESYIVRDGNPPIDPLEMKLHNVAGSFLQSEIERNGGMMKATGEGFEWLKTEMTLPSFCNLVFSYGGNTFAVVPVPMSRMQYQIPQNKKKLLLENAEKYHLIPCLFPVDVKTEKPLVAKWNLFNLITNSFVNPTQIPARENVPMSVWELRLLAINIVRRHLEEEGDQILSWQDVPEIQPQIWFRDSQGRESWIVMCSDNDADKVMTSVAPHADRLRMYPGYIAPVGFISPDMGIPKRQQGAFCNFRGLKEITPDMWS